MEPKELAKAGMWLIRQAITEVLRNHPGGAKPSDLTKVLNLKSEGGDSPGIVLAFLTMMLAEDEVEKVGEHHPDYRLKKRADWN